MASKSNRVAALMERHGTTYAEEAGIKVADKPSPLYRLLVLSLLLSARISADIAVAAARELSKAGYRTAERMAEATWQQRVDALGRGHYRRYDERTSTMLGDGAERLIDDYGGDLRRLHRQADSTPQLEKLLQKYPGIGPTGAAIFCREVQGVWTDVAPYVDKRVTDGAKSLGLPTSAERLAGLVSASDLPRLTAACVRAALDESVVDDLKGRAPLPIPIGSNTAGPWRRLSPVGATRIVARSNDMAMGRASTAPIMGDHKPERDAPFDDAETTTRTPSRPGLLPTRAGQI